MILKGASVIGTSRLHTTLKCSCRFERPNPFRFCTNLGSQLSLESQLKICPQLGVSCVVRLNAPQYNAKKLAAAGIAVVDLYFEDCTPPPVAVVAKFLALAETLPGALAVHCKAGLGRTGTLIALYMMKHYGFTAREAMGWLRIVRPGSVIGPQQQYLCEREEIMRRAGRSAILSEKSLAAVVAGAGALDGAEGVGRLAAATMRHVDELVEASARRMTQRAMSQSTPSTPETKRCPPAAAAGWSSSARCLAAHVSAASERRSGVRSIAGLMTPP